jgi:PAS domain S-box-containing protein
MSTTIRHSQSPIRHRLRVGGSPLLILAIALTLTGLVTQYVARTTRVRSRLRFDALVQQTNDGFTKRVATYVSLLSGASGLFAAKGDDVDRVAFRNYVARLGDAMHDPGVVGIGFTRRVRPGEAAALETAMRRQGFPSFRVWSTIPGNDRNPEREPLLYLEPETSATSSGLGIDMFAEPVRHAVMQAACDSGEAVASDRVFPMVPSGIGNPASFLIFLPVYSGGAVPATVQERRQRLYGFVFCPFRSEKLLDSTLGSDPNHRLDVSVYDARNRHDAHLLYQSKLLGKEGNGGSGFVANAPLPVAGKQWMAEYRPSSHFDESVIDFTPYIFAVGLAISALLFGIALSQMRARVAAEESADRLRQTDAALRASETRARRLIESNMIGVLRADFAGTVREANDAFLHLSGLTPDQIAAGTVTLSTLTPPEGKLAMEHALLSLRRGGTYPSFETTLLRSDGIRIPVLLGATRLEENLEGDEGPDGENREQFIAFLLDMTARKEAERQLRESEKHQRAFFRDVLASVTEGRLRLCDDTTDLPAPLEPFTDAGSVVLTKPTLRVARQATRNAAARAAIPAERAQDLLTAVGEATMNAVVHGGGGIARVSERDGTVQVWVEDWGSGIDMRHLPQATLERGFTTAGSLGHGFWLMLKTVDRLWLLTGPQGTTVVLEQDAVAIDPIWMQMPPSGSAPPQ